MEQSTPSSNGLLIGLMILTMVVSLGGVAYMAQRQSAADRAQRELIMSMLQAQAQTPPVQTVPGMNGGSMPSTGAVAPGSAGSMPAVTEPAPAVAPAPQGWGTVMTGNLSVSYPSTWKATRFADSAYMDQQNVRLTSQEGELRIGGGPGMRGVTYFDSGYQITISRVYEVETAGRSQPVQNPLVWAYGEGCDGAGCPSEEYLIEKDGQTYVLRAWYFVSNQESAKAVDTVQAILNSIK